VNILIICDFYEEEVLWITPNGWGGGNRNPQKPRVNKILV